MALALVWFLDRTEAHLDSANWPGAELFEGGLRFYTNPGLSWLVRVESLKTISVLLFFFSTSW